MEIKKITKQDGEYLCDINILKNEWKEILLDETLLSDSYKDALLKFYAEPAHKSTCKVLGDKYGVSPQTFNSLITHFAIAVQKKLNRFEVVRENGEVSYWVIPMLGKDVGEFFEWTMRPELVEAIDELDLLNKNLLRIESLKELIKKINKDLGEFKNKFRYKRKELAKLGRASSSGILFKYDNDDRNWSINEGGGTEVQYHIYYRDNRIGYGLGFNTQYVPFANKMSAVEYMQPYASAFIQLQGKEIVNSLTSKGFQLYDSSIDELYKLEHNCYYLFGKDIIVQNGMIFIYDYNKMLNELEFELFELYCSIFKQRNNIMKLESTTAEFITILESNKNLILTGAPGTGKTYLAKEIAKQIIDVKNEDELKFCGQYAFVQFHPSYDYTDFVEGLRPVKKDGEEIGFELKDGVFKKFCKRALNAKTFHKVDNFDAAWDDLLTMVRNNLANGELTKIGSWEYSLSSKDSLKYSSINTPSQYNFTITKRNVYAAYQNKQARPSGAFQKDMIEIVEYMKQHQQLKDFQEGEISSETDKGKFVIIIDEINRAEISKVFGELFFSIDPGYRGIVGRVTTQYANLQDEDDVFADGFYVPENVYIIGTMNDIDRSVESMDFAMRRRFAWKEIKAEDRVSMWEGQINKWIPEAKVRMNSLNKAIEKTQGLSTAYHIGPAYFLKLTNYTDQENPFESLWNNHLHGVIFEYLRGLPSSEDLIEDLKKAYNKQEDVESN